MADEAVQIARVSPVHREYVPTLGSARVRGVARVRRARRPTSIRGRRAAALDSVLAACRAGKVSGAGFHTARASASAAATANGNRRYFRSSDAGFSMTARSDDGTGSGYFAGDHFDLARLDAKVIAEQAVGKAVRARQPKPIEPATYPVILEPQAVVGPDRLPGLQLRCADRRRGPQRVFGEGRQDAPWRETVQRAAQPLQRSDAPGTARRPEHGRGIPAARLSLVKAGVLESLRYSRFWAQERKREPTPGPVNYIMESSQPPVSIDAMINGMERGLLISRFWYVRLVDPRSIALTGLTRDGLWWIDKGKISHPVRNLRFNQSVLAMLAPWNVDAIGAPQRLSPLMVPALKLNAFAFTSVSDAI